MAFDPVQEDCMRLVLASMKRERVYPLENATFVARCMRAYEKDPASLIKTDADRSFHLVAKATEIADYRLPFLSDEDEMDRLSLQVESYLDEATGLDPKNWDAQRMLAAVKAPTNDAYVGYLLDNRALVRQDMEGLEEDASDPYAREYASDLGRRPYLRWLAALSSRAFIAGQYRLSLSVAEEALALDGSDPTDVRHTGMLALAKLESTQEELEGYRKRHASAYGKRTSALRRRRGRPGSDAWSLMAEMDVAYRAMDFEGATARLHALLTGYPHAAEALYYQAEFPDGLFGRVNVAPKSEDELILATSESTPLLQEGFGAPDYASFSNWIAESELVQRELDKQANAPHRPFGTERFRGEN